MQKRKREKSSKIKIPSWEDSNSNAVQGNSQKQQKREKKNDTDPKDIQEIEYLEVGFKEAMPFLALIFPGISKLGIKQDEF